MNRYNRDREHEAEDTQGRRDGREGYYDRDDDERRFGERDDRGEARFRNMERWSDRSRPNVPRPSAPSRSWTEGNREFPNRDYYASRENYPNRDYYASEDNFRAQGNRYPGQENDWHRYSRPGNRQMERDWDRPRPEARGMHHDSSWGREARWPPGDGPGFGSYAAGAPGYSGSGLVGPSYGGYAGRGPITHGSGSSREPGSHYGKGPKGYVRSDERIKEDVCDRLSDDDEVDASEISVSVKDGEVTLEGSVSDRYSKHRAEDIAEAVSGVRDVNNRLRARKSIMREIGDKLAGEDPSEHRGHTGSGTRNSPLGATAKSPSH